SYPCSRRSCVSLVTIRSCRFPALSRSTCLRLAASSPPRATRANLVERDSRMRQFNLPDLGEGLEEAEIVAWYVSEGDNIVADQPLVSVETDKAVVEVPSPQSGRIAHLFGAKGDLVKVGAPLVEFAEGAQEDSGTVVGEIDRAQKAPGTAATGAEPARPRALAVLPA